MGSYRKRSFTQRAVELSKIFTTCIWQYIVSCVLVPCNWNWAYACVNQTSGFGTRKGRGLKPWWTEIFTIFIDHNCISIVAIPFQWRYWYCADIVAWLFQSNYSWPATILSFPFQSNRHVDGLVLHVFEFEILIKIDSPVWAFTRTWMARSHREVADHTVA